MCIHKRAKQTLEVVSFMKWKQIFFVKEAVTFILREQDILVKEVLSFIMKKQDNFVKEVVSFLKKLLVSRKQRKNSKFEIYFVLASHNISYVIFMKLKIEQNFK